MQYGSASPHARARQAAGRELLRLMLCSRLHAEGIVPSRVDSQSASLASNCLR
jgi:hypothetical protein